MRLLAIALTVFFIGSSCLAATKEDIAKTFLYFFKSIPTSIAFSGDGEIAIAAARLTEIYYTSLKNK